jgi:prepilin-type N-terminal cleavage/methylation domain-containing protein
VDKTRGFSLLEVLIVVAIILVIAMIAIPSLMKSRQAAHEATAVATLKTISTAEISYTTSSGGMFGTIPELISAGLLPSSLTSSIAGYDYNLEMAAGQRDYTVWANAVTSSEGRYDYYTSPDWVIRFSSDSTRAPAGMSSEPVQ